MQAWFYTYSPNISFTSNTPSKVLFINAEFDSRVTGRSSGQCVRDTDNTNE